MEKHPIKLERQIRLSTILVFCSCSCCDRFPNCGLGTLEENSAGYIGIWELIGKTNPPLNGLCNIWRSHGDDGGGSFSHCWRNLGRETIGCFVPFRRRELLVLKNGPHRTRVYFQSNCSSHRIRTFFLVCG